jgi:hypothetical protein
MKHIPPKSKSFEDRIAEHGRKLKEEADAMPPGKERDKVLKRAGQTEVAARATEWLESPGLRSPKWPGQSFGRPQSNAAARSTKPLNFCAEPTASMTSRANAPSWD